MGLKDFWPPHPCNTYPYFHVLLRVHQQSPGNCALLSGLDGVVRLLDRATGEMLNSYKGCVRACVRFFASV